MKLFVIFCYFLYDVLRLIVMHPFLLLILIIFSLFFWTNLHFISCINFQRTNS